MKLRDENQVRHLRAMERTIRAGYFLRHGADDPDDAVKRLYRTGNSGGEGSDDGSSDVDRQFEAMWLIDIELAKVVDWPQLDYEDDE